MTDNLTSDSKTSALTAAKERNYAQRIEKLRLACDEIAKAYNVEFNPTATELEALSLYHVQQVATYDRNEYRNNPQVSLLPQLQSKYYQRFSFWLHDQLKHGENLNHLLQESLDYALRYSVDPKANINPKDLGPLFNRLGSAMNGVGWVANIIAPILLQSKTHVDLLTNFNPFTPAMRQRSRDPAWAPAIHKMWQVLQPQVKPEKASLQRARRSGDTVSFYARDSFQRETQVTDLAYTLRRAFEAGTMVRISCNDVRPFPQVAEVIDNEAEKVYSEALGYQYANADDMRHFLSIDNLIALYQQRDSAVAADPDIRYCLDRAYRWDHLAMRVLKGEELIDGKAYPAVGYFVSKMQEVLEPLEAEDKAEVMQLIASCDSVHDIALIPLFKRKPAVGKALDKMAASGIEWFRDMLQEQREISEAQALIHHYTLNSFYEALLKLPHIREQIGETQSTILEHLLARYTCDSASSLSAEAMTPRVSDEAKKAGCQPYSLVQAAYHLEAVYQNLVAGIDHPKTRQLIRQLCADKESTAGEVLTLRAFEINPEHPNIAGDFEWLARANNYTRAGQLKVNNGKQEIVGAKNIWNTSRRIAEALIDAYTLTRNGNEVVLDPALSQHWPLLLVDGFSWGGAKVVGFKQALEEILAGEDGTNRKFYILHAGQEIPTTDKQFKAVREGKTSHPVDWALREKLVGLPNGIGFAPATDPLIKKQQHYNLLTVDNKNDGILQVLVSCRTPHSRKDARYQTSVFARNMDTGKLCGHSERDMMRDLKEQIRDYARTPEADWAKYTHINDFIAQVRQVFKPAMKQRIDMVLQEKPSQFFATTSDKVTAEQLKTLMPRFNAYGASGVEMLRGFNQDVDLGPVKPNEIRYHITPDQENGSQRHTTVMQRFLSGLRELKNRVTVHLAKNPLKEEEYTRLDLRADSHREISLTLGYQDNTIFVHTQPPLDRETLRKHLGLHGVTILDREHSIQFQSDGVCNTLLFGQSDQDVVYHERTRKIRDVKSTPSTVDKSYDIIASFVARAKGLPFLKSFTVAERLTQELAYHEARKNGQFAQRIANEGASAGNRGPRAA
jgi:hypothetical protein